MFLLPENTVRIMEISTSNNGGSNETALSMDLVMFCANVMNGARAWHRSNSSSSLVKSNMANLISLRPQGVAPHIVGIPIIA